MKSKNSSGVRAGRKMSVCILAAGALMGAAKISSAQRTSTDDHEHDYLHFSHPMVTESPSPDTKFRLDGTFGTDDERPGSHSMSVRAEGEFAFSRAFSVAVVVPFARITSSRDAATSALGSVEISAKAASFAFAGSGALVGGGVSLGLPTGSETKGIGSGHLYEIAPFFDAAVKRDNVEAVGMLTYSSAVNRNPGEESENSLTFDGSALWRVVPQIELLAEVTNSRPVGGSSRPTPKTFFAPGLKWLPKRRPKFAIGVTAICGLGGAKKINAVMTSLFYHF